MIGSIDPKKKSVKVVGSGISGLLSAYFLDRKGFEVSVFEKSDRPGGLINTIQTPHGMAETAAHSFLKTSPVEALCDEIGVDLIEVNPQSRAKYIYREGKMRRFPLQLDEVLSLVLKAGFSRAVECHNLAEWGHHHLGKGAVEYLLSPFLTGIYGATPEEISVSAAFPSLGIQPGGTLFSHQFRKKSKKERGKMVAPKKGMNDLIEKLFKRVQSKIGSRFHFGTEISKINSESNWVLTVPASATGKILAAEEPTLAAKLSELDYSPLLTVTVFVKKKNLRGWKTGVGVLMPPKERRSCLGILFNSSAFEERVVKPDLASFTFMFGGSIQPGWLEKSEQEISQAIQKELTDLFQFEGVIQDLLIHRWPNAIPKYSRELENAWALANKTWASQPGRVLFGNYTGQVSIRGMIESASSAWATSSFFHVS